MSLFRNASKRHQADTDRGECELPTNDSFTMEDFQCEVMRALWHPFEFLVDGESGTVQVSRLKVITASIGQKLGHKKAEEFLNKDGVTSMTFKEFFQVIKEELLDKIETPNQSVEDTNKTPSLQTHTTKQPTIHEHLNGIVKTCWTFCRFERPNKANGMTMDHCMILWRLFNFFSECDSDRKPTLPIRLHREEVVLILREFIDYTGQRNKEGVVTEFMENCAESCVISFKEFLNLFEKDFADSLSRNDISQGLSHLFDYYIMNVLAKGMMWKRGYNVKHWKERWLVLTTVSLKYYVNSSEKVQKGEIVFDNECKVEVPPDRPTHRANRFVITTNRKPYEISAPDAKTKHEWVSALQVALKCVDDNPNIQKEAGFKRCLERINKKRLAEEEERKRLDDAEHLKKQQDELNEEKRRRLEDEELLKARQNELDEERKRRAEMEDKLLVEQRLREEEQQRLRELEAIKLELERLLEEERQAKKDEEIVRNLQARLLEEEFQKREELEKLKQQQEEMLRAEREQKAVLEVDRQEQQRMLQEAKERLEQLERDRAAAAGKMQEATDKLVKAEKDRHIMEERVKLYKTKTSAGLNRPIQPHVDPLVTHRGHGAFCQMDFVKVKTDAQQNVSATSDEQAENYTDTLTEGTDKVSLKTDINEDAQAGDCTEVLSEQTDKVPMKEDIDEATKEVSKTDARKEDSVTHTETQNNITSEDHPTELSTGSGEMSCEPSLTDSAIEQADVEKGAGTQMENPDIAEKVNNDKTEASTEDDPQTNHVSTDEPIDTPNPPAQSPDKDTATNIRPGCSIQMNEDDDDVTNGDTTEPDHKKWTDSNLITDSHPITDNNLITDGHQSEKEDIIPKEPDNKIEPTTQSLDTDTQPDGSLQKTDSANTTPDDKVDQNEWTDQYLIADDDGDGEQQDKIINIGVMT